MENIYAEFLTNVFQNKVHANGFVGIMTVKQM